MNHKQLAAIREVEKAMQELSKSGLVLAGVDDSLVTFSRRQYYKLPKNQFGQRLGPAECINQLDYIAIDCPYLDSGGT